MKPVAIVRHAPSEEPGHFATFLEANSVPWRLIAVDRNEPLPSSSADFSGIATMGGPMSVNDPLPWIDHELLLLRDAIASGVPVIGHCLGGQMLCRALGGQVTASPAREIGWHTIEIPDETQAIEWFGKPGNATVFQWHGETFSIPDAAVRIATGIACANQAFASGPHLAMQFHVEMTADLIRLWCAEWAQRYDPRRPTQPSIQSPAEMVERIGDELPAMRRLAERLYGRWLRGVNR